MDLKIEDLKAGLSMSLREMNQEMKEFHDKLNLQNNELKKRLYDVEEKIKTLHIEKPKVKK